MIDVQNFVAVDIYGIDVGPYLREDKDDLTNATRKTKFTENKLKRRLIN
jgi:hypothetical protein